MIEAFRYDRTRRARTGQDKRGDDSIDRCIYRLSGNAAAPNPPHPEPPPVPAAATKYRAILLGEEIPADTLGELLVAVLRRLAQRDPGFLERLSHQTRRTRRIVARNANDLHPDRPDLSVYARQVTQGWWVGTNCSKRDVAAILEVASEVAGLTFRSDLSFEL